MILIQLFNRDRLTHDNRRLSFCIDLEAITPPKSGCGVNRVALVVRRISVLVAAGTVGVAIAVGSFAVGRALRGPETVARATATKVADADLVGTIPLPTASQLSPTPPLASALGSPLPPPGETPLETGARLSPVGASTVAAPAIPTCASNPNALGVSRVVEIDTTGGPGFGFEQFKAHDFLEQGEVVLTFDDGPWPGNTPAVLAALAAQCVKATFFPIGKHATWHPEILKQVVAQGHTIGSHTWSHADLARKPFEDAKEEIEKGISAVAISAGHPLAPFFRFPSLRQTPELTAYLGQRNIGIFSTDLDSFDFKMKSPDQVVESVMTKLKKPGKGIILMHDFQHPTALALPELLVQLKSNGYRVVQLIAKDTIATLPQYDSEMLKVLAGQSVDTRPTASVVRTISTYMSERSRP
jgi:peptidoglycan-N-acetylglucosamine deacetylase